MNRDIESKLEFDRMKEQVRSYALSYLGRQHVDHMEPLTDLKTIERLLEETEQARVLVSSGSSIPVPTLDGIERVTGLLGKGYLLDISEISAIYTFVHSTQQLKRYLERKYDVAPRVCSYAYALHDTQALAREIERCIDGGRVVDYATPELAKVRKKIATTAERIKKKLDSTLNKYRPYLQESVISVRSERYVLSVKKEFKRLVPGVILDESASGQTVFVEPADIQDLQSDMAGYQVQEEQEIARVLSYLTGLIEAEQGNLAVNLETVGYCDFLFAKGKYANEIGGHNVELNDAGIIEIHNGRHPFLDRTKSVPLNFSIGRSYRALMITGPNTGGKTVTLKTVGLLTLMVQSGILVPVEEGSLFSVFTEVLADIGDGQSIENSLSTFSAHIRNVIFILRHTGPRTLILLDELATGTDPGEGVGLSIAILEELYRRGAAVIATTHFNEIKDFAARTPGFENARMEFDLETLSPRYQLKIGEAGMSYAFQIALKLGVPKEIVDRSSEITQSSLHSEQHAAAVGRSAQPEVTPSAPTPSAALDRQGAGSGTRGDRVRRPAKVDVAYQIGDRVWIHAWKKSAIVCALPDDRGNLGVLVQKKRHTVNVKRVSPYLNREELYPEDYDLDIVLESKQVRKNRKVMGRKHVAGLVIEQPDSENTDRFR